MARRAKPPAPTNQKKNRSLNCDWNGVPICVFCVS
jgi:hypothetical protein